MPKNDDRTILDDHGLLRRVPANPDMSKFDYNLGQTRPTSVAFRDRNGSRELSITLEHDLIAGGGQHSEALEPDQADAGLVRLRANFVRNHLSQPQSLCREPTDLDPHHGLVCGDKSRRDLKDMARNCEVVLPLAGEGEAQE